MTEHAMQDDQRGAGRMLEYVEFHNPTEHERETDLVFDLRRLPAELRVCLRLTDLATSRPLDQALVGVEHRGALQRAKEEMLEWVEAGEHVVRWLDGALESAERALDAVEPERRREPVHPLPRFAQPIYVAKPSALVELRGVRLGGFAYAAALIAIEKRSELPPGSEYRFDVQQRIREQIVGGSTFVVRIAGIPRVPKRPQPIGPEGEGGDHDVGLPPWLRKLGQARDRLHGRK
jgi:hypothetical protein